jgi:hypothetical protein
VRERKRECQTYAHTHGSIVKIRNREARSKASDRLKAQQWEKEKSSTMFVTANLKQRKQNTSLSSSACSRKGSFSPSKNNNDHDR